MPKEIIIGIRDIKYGDIQRKLQGYETAQLRGYGIFEENLKGVRDTQTLPPPLMGPLYSVTCLKGKKILEAWKRRGKS